MILYALLLLVAFIGCVILLLNIPTNFAAGEQKISAGINDLLPQTQCQQCGFYGCKPYADAIARSAAPVNRCPPGGLSTANAIADLIGATRVSELSPFKPVGGNDAPVRIDEEVCIGCTKCLPACPVDAIIGAQKQLHIVLTDVCTGCGLCIPPCPVDCISFTTQPERPPHAAATRQS